MVLKGSQLVMVLYELSYSLITFSHKTTSVPGSNRFLFKLILDLLFRLI
jgi:hypothetical protein